MITADTIKLPNGRSSLVYRGGSGPTVVYLHNAGGIVPNDPFVETLSTKYRVVAPLSPGFRDLGELDEIRDIHDLVLHYDDVLTALEIDQAAFIGHSLGGMVAAEIAAHYPTRVSKLGLISPAGLWNPDYPMADLFSASPPEQFALLLHDLEGPLAKAMIPPPMDPMNIPDAFIEPMIAFTRALAASSKFLTPLPDKGLARRLYRIRADTLILWGAQDKLIPAKYAADFARGIRRSHVEIIDQAAHMVLLEQLPTVVGHLMKFIGG